jgi:ketosteroid isomerase-like protein
MPAQTPQILVTLLCGVLRDLDIAAAVELYEEQATLAVFPGTLCTGKASIRKSLEGLFRAKPVIRFELKNIAECGDVALFTAKWTSSRPPNAAMSKTNYQAAILRRQPDAHWLIAVDNPWGPAPTLLL